MSGVVASVRAARSRRMAARPAVAPAAVARALALAAAADSVGSGVFASTATVFFVSHGIIGAGQAALAATVAGVTALAVQAVTGQLANRIDVPRVYAAVTALRCVAYLGFVFVDDVASYFSLLVVAVCADRTASPLFQLLVAVAVPGDCRVRTMARVRAYRNVGLAAGFGLAALALAAGELAVRLAFTLNAMSFLGLSAVALWLRRGGADPRRPQVVAQAEARSAAPSRDRRYLAFTVGNAVLSLHDAVLFVGIPIWLVERTDLSLSVVPLALVLNAGITVAAQTVLARSLTGGRAVRTLLMPAGGLLLAACGCMVFVTRGTADLLALTLLCAAITALSIGENVQAVAGWELSFELAPERDHGRHVALFNVGISAQKAVGPGIVTATLLMGGPVGWGALGVVFLISAAVVRVAAGSAAP